MTYKTGTTNDNDMRTDFLKAVILDFDGTIADTRSLIVSTMQQTIRELALPERSDSQCAAMIGLPLKQSFITLLSVDDATADVCTATYRRIFADNNKPGAVRVFPNVIETIRAMHSAGLTVTIASSRSHASLAHFTEEMRLSDNITYMLGGDDVAKAKPEPDMVLKTLADNRLRPEEAVVVGDTVFDIAMGRAAGVATVGVTYGNGHREDMAKEGADWIIDDFGLLRPTPADVIQTGRGTLKDALITVDSAGNCLLKRH